tara:strand:- start:433 stop:1056 length:624 start_codon:yes stop_codon:yes gene_type:complete
VVFLKKIILLGDSIIDNKIYVEGNELSVTEHLNKIQNNEVIQLAVDGDTTHDVLSEQIKKIPKDATDLVLSIGGNDLLHEIDFLFQNILYKPNKALKKVGSLLSPIISRYETIVRNLSNHRANLLLCTIYEGDLVNSDELNSVIDSSKTMVSLFNDAIYRNGKKFKVDVLELRDIFVSPEDYANPIEPSHIGGGKLAKAIKNWVDSE